MPDRAILAEPATLVVDELPEAGGFARSVGSWPEYTVRSALSASSVARGWRSGGQLGTGLGHGRGQTVVDRRIHVFVPAPDHPIDDVGGARRPRRRIAFRRDHEEEGPTATTRTSAAIPATRSAAQRAERSGGG